MRKSYRHISRLAKTRSGATKYKTWKRVANKMDTLERVGSRGEHQLEDGKVEKHEVGSNTNSNDGGKFSFLDTSATPGCSLGLESRPSVPPLRALSFLDRFLVLWILLAMAIGILLGNLVPSTGPDLQKGQFVGVSIPIGKGYLLSKKYYLLTLYASHWSSCHDVPHLMQGPLRNTASPPKRKVSLGSNWFLVRF